MLVYFLNFSKEEYILPHIDIVKKNQSTKTSLLCEQATIIAADSQDGDDDNPDNTLMMTTQLIEDKKL